MMILSALQEMHMRPDLLDHEVNEQWSIKTDLIGFCTCPAWG